MSRYDRIKDLSDEEFRRLTGVKKQTFSHMVQILDEAEQKKLGHGGRKPKLGLVERLLMCLEYLREYRTYFHIGQSYGVSESTCCRNCKWVEDVLIKDATFSLPGKKALVASDMEYEIILVDATESPVERPQKRSV